MFSITCSSDQRSELEFAASHGLTAASWNEPKVTIAWRGKKNGGRATHVAVTDVGEVKLVSGTECDRRCSSQLFPVLPVWTQESTTQTLSGKMAARPVEAHAVIGEVSVSADAGVSRRRGVLPLCERERHWRVCGSYCCSLSKDAHGIVGKTQSESCFIFRWNGHVDLVDKMSQVTGCHWSLLIRQSLWTEEIWWDVWEESHWTWGQRTMWSVMWSWQSQLTVSSWRFFFFINKIKMMLVVWVNQTLGPRWFSAVWKQQDTCGFYRWKSWFVCISVSQTSCQSTCVLRVWEQSASYKWYYHNSNRNLNSFWTNRCRSSLVWGDVCFFIQDFQIQMLVHMFQCLLLRRCQSTKPLSSRSAAEQFA